jgi:MFS family permease
VTIDFEDDVRLLKNARFRRLLESRLVGQTAQNALLYSLLILLVKHSGSSIHSTLLIVAITIPAIIFGIPAGTLADFLPRRFSLTFGYLARAGVSAALFYFHGDLWHIYGLVLLNASIGQLFSPAEQAAVPTLVRRDQLSAANSLMMLTLVLGQIAGIVMIAPLLIWLIAPEAVFLLCAGLFLFAAYIIGWLTADFAPLPGERTKGMGFVAAMMEGFHILRNDRRAYLAMLYLVTATALSRVLIILLPKYTRDVLQISPEDTAFVAAPAAIGAALGLVFVPVGVRLFGAWRVVIFGFATLLVGMLGLGLVVYVRDFIIQNFNFGFGFLEFDAGVPSVITMAMLLAIPLGFAYTLVSVGTRVVMNQQAPLEAQGRVFAVQTALGDTLSLLPLLLVGVVADLVGARATLLASAAAAMAATGYLTFSHRWGPRGTLAQTAEPARQPGLRP